MNDEYIPNPSRSDTAFVVQTPRIRIIRMSTSGCGERVSLRTQKTSKTIPNTSAPIVFAESQCHTAVSLTATSTATNPSDINIAPAQLTRPGTLIGDSGTRKCVATVTMTIGISGSQKR